MPLAPAALLALLSALPAAPSDPAEMPAPFLEARSTPRAGELGLRLDTALHAALRGQRRVALRGFPLPNGSSVDLALEQRAWRGMLGVPRVDGRERMDLFLGHDLTTWRGTVAGHPDSRVSLGFSRHGSHGFLRFADQLFVVRGRPSADGAWDQGHLVVQDASARPSASAFTCGSGPSPTAPAAAAGPAPAPRAGPAARAPALRAGPAARAPAPRAGIGPTLAAGAVPTQHARLAASVDFWVAATFAFDLPAEIAYVYTLLWSVGELFLDELSHPLVDFVVTMPYVEFWTTFDDPWDAPDLGTDNKGDVLDEFEETWDTIFDEEEVHLALLLCGRTIGGGKASGVSIDAKICPDGALAELGEHAVVGDIDNQMTFPPAQGNGTWEFVVIAHELGHNLGALHTDELGIDDCDDLDPDDCPEGTIMSYCHLCVVPGMTVMSNIALEFDETNTNLMWTNLDGQDCALVIDAAPIHVNPVFDGFPDGSTSKPFPNLFEAMYLGGLLGGPASTVRIRGALPGGLEGTQEWPALLFGQSASTGAGVTLTGWPSLISPGTIGG